MEPYRNRDWENDAKPSPWALKRHRTIARIQSGG
jgi:hypothetical protein